MVLKVAENYIMRPEEKRLHDIIVRMKCGFLAKKFSIMLHTQTIGDDQMKVAISCLFPRKTGGRRIRIFQTGIYSIANHLTPRSDLEIAKLIMSLTLELFKHEMDESFKLDGVFVSDPHPKHTAVKNRLRQRHKIGGLI